MKSAFAFQGAYSGDRAAALAGVPKSTVYYWARVGVLVPSVSQSREKLWSYADLMALRIIYWLRKRKGEGTNQVGATPMLEIRRALNRLDDKGFPLWQGQGTAPNASPILVDEHAHIHLAFDDSYEDIQGQMLLGDRFLDLLGPFSSDGLNGPNLVAPRPSIRIVPGKVVGQPHIAGSRISTLTIAALALRGFNREAISKLYPDQAIEALDQAIDLEKQLEGNRLAA